MRFSTDSERWQALCLRTPAAHSSFFYGVVTTRIFCRPTCSSRLARRANVIFFTQATDAARAGFRACKRCKPEIVDQMSVDGQRLDTVKRACDMMKNSSGDAAPQEIARKVGLSYRYFHGIFKQVTGMTPIQYAKNCNQTTEEGGPDKDAAFPPVLGAETPLPLPYLPVRDALLPWPSSTLSSSGLQVDPLLFAAPDTFDGDGLASTLAGPDIITMEDLDFMLGELSDLGAADAAEVVGFHKVN